MRKRDLLGVVAALILTFAFVVGTPQPAQASPPDINGELICQTLYTQGGLAAMDLMQYYDYNWFQQAVQFIMQSLPSGWSSWSNEEFMEYLNQQAYNLLDPMCAFQF